MALEEDRRISDVVNREQSRLRNFIRRRVPDPRDAEDILQDVFYELVEANRLLMPQAARNIARLERAFGPQYWPFPRTWAVGQSTEATRERPGNIWLLS